MENVSDEVVEKTKHIFYVSKLFSKNRALCEILWKNIVQVTIK